MVVAAGEEDIEGVALPIGPFKYSQKRALFSTVLEEHERAKKRTQKINLGLL